MKGETRKIVCSYPVLGNRVGYKLCDDLATAKDFLAKHPGAHIVINKVEIQRAVSRAVKVKFSDMKKPGLLAVNNRREAFTEEEILALTAKVATFALTDDGDHLFIWGE